MARLNVKAIDERIQSLGNRESYHREFIFDLLGVYGKPKSTITRLRSGALNVAADPDHEVALKKDVYFHELDRESDNTLEVLINLSTEQHVTKYAPRFIIATNYCELVALDTKTGENLIIPIREIAKHFTFFLPWAGMEKTQYVAEAHADIKAAESMGKLFDELLKANPTMLDDPTKRHGLNVFFTRLLFCFFAEDTGIFADNQFTNAVGSHTQSDGSDVQEFLTDLFLALDTANPADRPAYLSEFPYVNGRLFSKDKTLTVPAFTKHARKLLIDLGTLIWQEINPDIFGSMFQAIVTPGKRSDLGQHYTSVPNILKTIEPLFLDNLREQFNTHFDNITQLEKLRTRISKISIFDPACGSGNFLVIAYKELRRLEHAILERLVELDPNRETFFDISNINIENFYGIEIDDFAVEVAILSLWIAKHQMNQEFKDKFGAEIPLIPLKESGRIKVGNAARTDWNEVCPNDGQSEIYLIGNPPYGGSKKLKAAQKEDFNFVFGNRPFSKNLDYISLWFVKGADYIKGTKAQFAFVSTNSVAQGEHVSLLFPSIFSMGIEISYAYSSFKWENNAKRNAGVTVVVIGLRNESNEPKFIYSDGLRTTVKNINGYLADGANLCIGKRSAPLTSTFPKMSFGSMPNSKYLVFTPVEAENILNADGTGKIAHLIKPFLGSNEYINSIDRYCLWIEDRDLEIALRNIEIEKRVQATMESRLESDRKATKALAEIPHRFGECRYKPTDSIIVPSISSGRREYIPIGFLGPDTVISNKAFAVYDAEPWLFAVLTSKMHMTWVNAVSGRMREDYQYSNTIVYNNFPVPPLSSKVKELLTQAALRVLDVREYYCGSTLAELYDPDKMPDNLRAAHKDVDRLVDSLYSKRPFETDEERLAVLFDLYETMITAEQLHITKPKRKAKK